MYKSIAKFALVAAGASLLAGCASDGSSLLPAAFTTQSITPAATSTQTAAAAQPKADPMCQALAVRIETLRREGVVERAEKAAQGKGSTVQVKRMSLAQLADLDRANAEFQARCSIGPKPAQSAMMVPGSPTPAATPAAPVQTTATVVPAGTSAPARPVAASAPAAVAPPPVIVQQKQ